VRMHVAVAAIVAGFSSIAHAQNANIPEPAVAFGAREAIQGAVLSPNGTKIAFLGPASGSGVILYAMDTTKDTRPHVVLKSSGEPERLSDCVWVANDRLACQVSGYQKGIGEFDNDIIGFSNVIAINDDGSNLKLLSKRRGMNALSWDNRGGEIIDLLPDADGSVLMMRSYVPEAKIGSLVESTADGIGVDQIDTRTLAVKRVEPARKDAVEYISDGLGNVRILGIAKKTAEGYDSGQISYLYRPVSSHTWESLNILDSVTGQGFSPYSVDPQGDIVYGFAKSNGRQALVSISLADRSLSPNIVLSRPDVDVDGLIRIGRKQRVVGASFATDRREAVYFDADLKRLAAGLGKALPNQPLIEFVDSSQDESKLLIWAGGDTSPGTYYLFDRATKKLQPIMPVRPELEGANLASVKAVTYAAADGAVVPAYLTLPPGSAGKNIPAIVMPHGGPSARDEWGFDWLVQYFANRGFAVFQPNYRGSSGYGDSWYEDNGFRSWKIAIGDVNDAGRWLVKSGIADPGKLFIVGWSYGGYAALQSAVLEPGLFKAVVAIAPVTDFAMRKAEWRKWDVGRLVEEQMGTGPHIKEGSPAQNAARISVPVLMFHGEMDRNVRISQSRFMAKQLLAAGKKVELVEYPKLEHSLVDSAVRADLLKKSTDFLLAAGK